MFTVYFLNFTCSGQFILFFIYVILFFGCFIVAVAVAAVLQFPGVQRGSRDAHVLSGLYDDFSTALESRIRHNECCV